MLSNFSHSIAVDIQERSSLYTISIDIKFSVRDVDVYVV